MLGGFVLLTVTPILERRLCVGIKEGSVRVDLRDGMKYLGWPQLPFLVPSFFSCPRGFFSFPILFYPKDISGSKSAWLLEFMLILLIDIPGRDGVLCIDWYEMSNLY